MLAKGQHLTLLCKFNLPKGAHAQQYLQIAHAGVDACPDISEVDATNLQVANDCLVNRDGSVGGHGLAGTAVGQVQALCRCLWNHDIGCTRVQQEIHGFAIDRTGDQVMSPAVLLQGDLDGLGAELGFRIHVRIALFFFHAREEPRQHYHAKNHADGHHALAGSSGIHGYPCCLGEAVFYRDDKITSICETRENRLNIVEHRLVGAKFVESPNQDARPAGEISLIVVHGISLPPGEFAGDAVTELFTNRLDATGALADLEGVRVSSHLYIRRDGSLIQYVPFDRRAWHAGESAWLGRHACNDFAVGIELEGTDQSGYTDVQYSVLVYACVMLIKRYGITQLAGHCHIAPGRKTDPGPAFDWWRLKRSLAGALTC